MRDAAPMVFVWDGETLRPANKYWTDKAAQHFKPGQPYRMAENNDRSSKTHRHFFACLNEAHANMPERLQERFPTPDHLRKWALIETGFRTERSLVCASPEEALKVAAFLRPVDEFAIVIVRESTVIEYRAKSQDYQSMDKKDFQASKVAVLEWISTLIGVELEALLKRAKISDMPERRTA